jgi:hypothetical protein
MITKNASTAGNQQETNDDSNYYISGFCAGEMSCSVIKQTRNYGSGFSYSPDFTVTNADINLLKQVNYVLAQGKGVISKVKGAYNLSFRGKQKVKSVLDFFAKYPIIVGKLANSRLFLLEKACATLNRKEGSTRRLRNEVKQVEQIRSRLREIKIQGNDAVIESPPSNKHSRRAKGFFLSGVFDADGSIGLRKRGRTYQPFMAVAMKDKEIPLLFQRYFNFGYIYKRSKSNIYHFETGKRANVYKALKTFLFQYPSRQCCKRKKLEKLLRILNDYTHNATNLPIYYDGKLW